MQNLQKVENFSIEQLTKIYDEAKAVKEGKLWKKDLDSCKQYLQKTIFCLDDGKTNCIFKENVLDILDKDQFNSMIFNRFPCKELKEFFKSSPEIKYFKLSSEKSASVVDYAKNRLYNSPSIKAKYSKYESFPEKTKRACHLMLSHIRDINCGGDKVQYEYLLKIIKRMCLGIKNNICVVIRTLGQGNGKSTFLKFLEQRVIGESSTCIGTSRMVISGFNYPMYNKILVKFEELPCFSKEQYKGISGSFKTWITEDYINYEDKGKASFNSYNCHTMFVISNNDCIDDDDGRRYFILDHTNRFVDDEEGKNKYFNELYSNCFTQEVADCFYSFLMDTIEVPDNFDGSSTMPATKNKATSTAQKLAKPFVFLKEKYLLKELDINKKIKELYQEYTDERKYFRMNAETFHKHLKESQLAKFLFVSGGYPKLKVSHSELKSIYTKNNWIGEFDEYDNTSIEKEFQDVHSEEIDEYKRQIAALTEELNKLKQQVKPKQEPEPEIIIIKSKQTKKTFNDELDELERELSEMDSVQTQDAQSVPETISSNNDEQDEEEDEDLELFGKLLNAKNNKVQKPIYKKKTTKPSLTLEL